MKIKWKDMKEEMEKFKNMNADSMKMMMDKGMQALDSIKVGNGKKINLL